MFYKILLIISAILCLNGKAFANDGWGNSYSGTSGELFSPIEHPSISLKKEVLILKNMNTWEVNYLFYNDSDKDLEVPVLFPISTTFPAKNSGDTIYFLGGYGDTDGKYPFILNDFLNPQCKFLLPNYDEVDESDYMYIDSNILKTPYRKFINIKNNYNEILALIETHKHDTSENSRYPILLAMNETYEKYYKSFKVMQDGEQVMVDSIMFESKYNPNPKEDKISDSIYNKEFITTIYYPHKLFFPANKYSKVSIKYIVATATHGGIAPNGFDLGTWFSPSYSIGPGSTWKGPIEDFYFIYPKSFLWDSVFYQDNYVIKSDNEFCWNNYKMNILHAKNYEPNKDEVIKLSYFETKLPSLPEYYDSTKNLIKLFDIRLDSFVSYKLSDNFIKSFYKYNTNQTRKIKANYNSKKIFPVYFFGSDNFIEESSISENNKLNIKANSEALFDGLIQSPCLLGDKLSKSYSVDFELNENSYGIQIFNGFWGYNLNHLNFQTEYFNNIDVNDSLDYKIKTNFRNYARAKTLSLENLTNKTRIDLKLSDTILQFLPYFLEKGKYRISLVDYYTGDIASNPVCISEIQFLPFKIEPDIFSDDFVKNILYKSFNLK